MITVNIEQFMFIDCFYDWIEWRESLLNLIDFNKLTSYEDW
jgi:hypothetical protein